MKGEASFSLSLTRAGSGLRVWSFEFRGAGLRPVSSGSQSSFWFSPMAISLLLSSHYVLIGFEYTVQGDRVSGM